MNPFIIIMLIFIIFFVCGFFDVDSERFALAQDIKSGNLILTIKAARMIVKGDAFLIDAGREKSYESGRKMNVRNTDLFRAFIAKVWFERARLEMEMRNGR